jgi:AbrB family looped-hinge helix DNA binding protein
MDADMTVMSEKGQVVIPSRIRRRMKMARGTRFAVVSSKDGILLKRVRSPTKMELLKELEAITKGMSDDLKAMGMTEKEVIEIAVNARKR